MSFVCFDVLASTHFLCTFILTCKPSISVRGPKIFIQSFFSGVIRWGGIAILRISDLRVERVTEAGAGAKTGAEEGLGRSEGWSSMSISSSSSTLSFCDDADGREAVGATTPSRTSVMSPRSMSWSPSSASTLMTDDLGGATLGAGLREMVLRFFFFGGDDGEAAESDWTTTIVCEVKQGINRIYEKKRSDYAITDFEDGV
jgi:hypothetical protein